MELQDYLAIVRKRWLSILLITLLVTGAAVAATLLAVPTYSARSQVYVSLQSAGTAAPVVSRVISRIDSQRLRTIAR